MGITVGDITGFGEIATAAEKIIGMFHPDKTQQEQQQMANDLALLTKQLDVDQAEAQSTDPLQHWRGGAGWTCVAGFAWAFVIRPMAQFVLVSTGHHIQLPQLDTAPLLTLMGGMLGLGGMHVFGQVKGVK